MATSNKRVFVPRPFLSRPATGWLSRVVLLGLCVGFSPLGLAADDAKARTGGFLDWFDSLYLQAGYGVHWSNDDDYDGKPVLGGLEAGHDDKQVVGVSLFENSFGQFSQYYYYGYKWRLPFISDSLQFKLTGGFIHGYTGEYEDKLAWNNNGWAPAIIPSLGWKKDRIGFDVAVLGSAGVMFLVGYDVWTR